MSVLLSKVLVLVVLVTACAGAPQGATDDDPPSIARTDAPAETESETTESETTEVETEDGVRTVHVRMTDIAFDVERLEVAADETVRFVFTNDGQLPHDAFIGDEAAQDQHATEMTHARHHDHGDDDAAISLEPGETGEMTHTFDQAGTTLIGCHVPGHYAAGMRIEVVVS